MCMKSFKMCDVLSTSTVQHSSVGTDSTYITSQPVKSSATYVTPCGEFSYIPSSEFSFTNKSHIRTLQLIM